MSTDAQRLMEKHRLRLAALETPGPEQTRAEPELPDGTAPEAPRSRSRNGVLYTVVADDVACGFLSEGHDEAGPEPLLWEEFLGWQKEVFLG